MGAARSGLPQHLRLDQAPLKTCKPYGPPAPQSAHSNQPLPALQMLARARKRVSTQALRGTRLSPSCEVRGLVDPPVVVTIGPKHPLVFACTSHVRRDGSPGPAFPRREVSWPRSVRPEFSPISSLAAWSAGSPPGLARLWLPPTVRFLGDTVVPCSARASVDTDDPFHLEACVAACERLGDRVIVRGLWRRTTPSPRRRSHTLDADEMTVGCDLLLALWALHGPVAASRWGSLSATTFASRRASRSAADSSQSGTINERSAEIGATPLVARMGGLIQPGPIYMGESKRGQGSIRPPAVSRPCGWLESGGWTTDHDDRSLDDGVRPAGGETGADPEGDGEACVCVSASHLPVGRPWLPGSGLGSAGRSIRWCQSLPDLMDRIRATKAADAGCIGTSPTDRRGACVGERLSRRAARSA